MKRYLIFGAIGPLVGGFLMLFATTVASGYWNDTNWSEIGKFLGAFVRTLQYSYLFGIIPALMVGAIDDILYHVKRIAPAARMLIVGAIGFAALIALWFARAGYRHDAVPALRPRRHGARDAVVLAGAQICRRAAGRCIRRDGPRGLCLCRLFPDGFQLEPEHNRKRQDLPDLRRRHDAWQTNVRLVRSRNAT